MSKDQLELRGIISILSKAEQDEVFSKAEEIRQVIRSSKFGLVAVTLVGMELQDDPKISAALEGVQ